MKKNMGAADRIIRLAAALLIAVLYFTDLISGITGLIPGILAIVFILTSAVGFCPLYVPLGFSTCKKQ